MDNPLNIIGIKTNQGIFVTCLNQSKYNQFSNLNNYIG